MSIAYEAEGVFDPTRNPDAFSYEWEDMPKAESGSEQDRAYKKTYYLTLKRLDNSREFFLKVLKLQPRFMAVFGLETESIFKQLNIAHVHVQVSAQSLMRPERGEWSGEKQKEANANGGGRLVGLWHGLHER
jgi:hypothetical protein